MYDANRGQLLRSLHRQGAQAYRIQQLKNSRIRANAQGKRQNSDGHKTRIPEQQTCAIAEVAPQACNQPFSSISAYWQWRAGGVDGGLQAGSQSAVVEFPEQCLIGEVGADSANQHLVIAVAQMLAEFFDHFGFAHRDQDSARRWPLESLWASQAFSASVMRWMAMTKFNQVERWALSISLPGAVSL